MGVGVTVGVGRGVGVTVGVDVGVAAASGDLTVGESIDCGARVAARVGVESATGAGRDVGVAAGVSCGVWVGCGPAMAALEGSDIASGVEVDSIARPSAGVNDGATERSSVAVAVAADSGIGVRAEIGGGSSSPAPFLPKRWLTSSPAVRMVSAPGKSAFLEMAKRPATPTLMSMMKRQPHPKLPLPPCPAGRLPPVCVLEVRSRYTRSTPGHSSTTTTPIPGAAKTRLQFRHLQFMRWCRRRLVLMRGLRQ